MKPKPEILEKACPHCRGDILTNYKGRALWKCVACSRIGYPVELLTSGVSHG